MSIRFSLVFDESVEVLSCRKTIFNSISQKYKVKLRCKKTGEIYKTKIYCGPDDEEKKMTFPKCKEIFKYQLVPVNREIV